MTLSGFVAYIKQLWANKPSTSSPLSAERLNHMEEGIKANSDGITKIVTSVTDQVVNDTNKIASAASLYSVKQDVVKVNSDLTDGSTLESGYCKLPNGLLIQWGSIIGLSVPAGGKTEFTITFPAKFSGTTYWCIPSLYGAILGQVSASSRSDSSISGVLYSVDNIALSDRRIQYIAIGY